MIEKQLAFLFLMGFIAGVITTGVFNVLLILITHWRKETRKPPTWYFSSIVQYNGRHQLVFTKSQFDTNPGPAILADFKKQGVDAIVIFSWNITEAVYEASKPHNPITVRTPPPPAN